MSDYAFPPMTPPCVPILGGALFPVRRIFCIGRNYADHVAEMGGDLQKTPPTFFTKPADAVFSGGVIDYPMATQNFHYEGELVVALGQGGATLTPQQAGAAIFGYACGCDLTRRDLQDKAKQQRGPWDSAKALDKGAGVGIITPVEEWQHRGDNMLRLLQNDQMRQQAPLSDMIWPIDEILAKLSHLFTLAAGDLVFTGTPAGVGSIEPGDTIKVSVDGLQALAFTIKP